MVVISGTPLSAMGVPQLLYNAIFIWCQNMAVGAQNDLGGQQTFARKMT